jgi:uncharacterized protein with HEPN domain
VRNILAHNYDGADAEVIHETIIKAVPDLIVQLRQILAQIEAQK